MDAGASIIGFVGFGLASIKTFYEFVSSIRDGPEKVRDLSRVLASLQGAYERTKSLNDLPGVSCASPSLASLLERCNEDVARFEKKIGKLHIRPQDKFHGVLWKKLKMALGEDDIAYALDIISGYVNDIALEIGLIDLRFSHQNSTGIAQVIAEGEKHSFTMSRISEGVFQSVTKMQQESVAQLQPSRARELEETHAPAIPAEEVHPQGDKSDGDGYHDDVALSVKRLCALLDWKDRLAESEEAQDILDNLDTLLQDLRSANVEFIHHGAVGESSEVDNKAVLRDLRQFRGILNSSVELSLNHELPEQRMIVTGPGKVRGSSQHRAIYDGRHGTWTILTRKRWRVYAAQDGEKLLQENTTSVFLRPRTNGSQYLIRATVRQFHQMYGFHSPTPTISISRIRPRSSRVFECVRRGLMDEFLQLLKTGEASLQDRDDLGASLLHVGAPTYVTLRLALLTLLPVRIRAL
ncbi:hypothetical protein CMUS01_12368 [Colletotrichum musicola]|uniref:Azaphilone pigments biosynthesis cluster protein L N-terminal domain-containing protein n=1 Tax=Colletotrichum musicola TaxID=2175873 RepID=A0A8H6JMS6_9PEZI|nr:hypothetical protein CMUS01_12368 [Colletotrichum musicola]